MSEFQPGEFLRDPTDARFLKVLPRVKDEPDSTYVKRLAHNGLAVVIEREEIRTGGYAAALQSATSLGVPLLVPYEEGESRPKPVQDRPAIDMVQFRRDAAAREADPGYNSPINPPR
jgi:hypothetical protein